MERTFLCPFTHSPVALQVPCQEEVANKKKARVSAKAFSRTTTVAI
jgi:hypothetical protein